MQIGVEVSRMVENRRIFVVVEDEIVRAALQFMLHDENEAHEVPDLAAAFAKASRFPPDLLLLDLGIVWREGMGVLARISQQLPEAKVLLVAESDHDPDAHACVGVGAHGVLGKPFVVAGVRRKVDQVLGRIPSLAAAA